MKLEGKIAIVTGAGKGIGREAALAIAEEGATVVAVARTQADLDETVKMIEEKGGKAVSLSGT
ncbi:MAG: SDR family NAD(P)-dependent oxidoreductase [[Clostridium] scindens]